MPAELPKFRRTAERGFQIVYELCLGLGTNLAVSCADSGLPAVPKRGDFEPCIAASLRHPGRSRPGRFRLGHRHRRHCLGRAGRRRLPRHPRRAACDRRGIRQADRARTVAADGRPGPDLSRARCRRYALPGRIRRAHERRRSRHLDRGNRSLVRRRRWPPVAVAVGVPKRSPDVSDDFAFAAPSPVLPRASLLFAISASTLAGSICE